jgi:hypothetical protein
MFFSRQGSDYQRLLAFISGSIPAMAPEVALLHPPHLNNDNNLNRITVLVAEAMHSRE